MKPKGEDTWRLADHDINLSRPQVYRVVNQRRDPRPHGSVTPS